jgi:hypothetical protein
MIIQNNPIVQTDILYELPCSEDLYSQNNVFQDMSIASPYKNVLKVLTERSLKRSIGHMLDG